MLEDIAIVAALRAATDWRRLDPAADGAFDYRLTDVRAQPGRVDVRLEQRDGASARLVVELPGSGAPQYWLHARPDDAADWVGQLLTWIDEEVFTGGLVSGRVREERGGEGYVVVANYGWQLEDPAEHDRLTAAAGPIGWHGDVSA